MSTFLLYFSISFFVGIFFGALSSFRRLVSRSLMDASDN